MLHIEESGQHPNYTVTSCTSYSIAAICGLRTPAYRGRGVIKFPAFPHNHSMRCTRLSFNPRLPPTTHRIAVFKCQTSLGGKAGHSLQDVGRQLQEILKDQAQACRVHKALASSVATSACSVNFRITSYAEYQTSVLDHCVCVWYVDLNSRTLTWTPHHRRRIQTRLPRT